LFASRVRQHALEGVSGVEKGWQGLRRTLPRLIEEAPRRPAAIPSTGWAMNG
jgi:hypothetical protein